MVERLVRETGKGMILIYCATRRTVEEVAAWLGQSHKSVDYYHAGLSDEERRLVHDKFRRGVLRILVATNAFGMGIDKPDVRLVAHFDIPGSLEAYYQEAGRAGRDGQPAACVLLFHERDVATQEYFIAQASKDSEGVERAERMTTLLQELLRYVSVSTCRQLAILEYFSDEAELALGPCGLCDRCIAPIRQSNREVVRDDAVAAKQPRRVNAGSTGASHVWPPDPQLLKRLRQLRSDLAEEEGVAPFLIFHDRTLKAIAGYKPETAAALLEIPGIGEIKVERYGRRLLAVVNEFP